MASGLLIGERLRIVPEGAGAPADGRVAVRLARGAFGSGEHETTRSCLEVLGALEGLQGARVLDLGSGTGVLAIAAVLLGARHAVCVDPDSRAVATARRNCELNGVSGAVTHIQGTLADVPPGRRFEVVLANLYGDVLLPILEALADRAVPGGVMLLSGIAWEYDYEVRRRLAAAGCTVLRHCMLEEYSTVVSVVQQAANPARDGKGAGHPG